MIRVLGESFEPARSDAFRPRDGHLTDHLLHLVVPPAIRHCDELFCGAGLLNRRVKSATSHVGKARYHRCCSRRSGSPISHATERAGPMMVWTIPSSDLRVGPSY